MARSQVHHVYVVPHARPVGRRVVISENPHLVPAPHGDLSYKRKKVVWYTARVFSDPAGFVRANGVEVPKKGDAPPRVRRAEVGKDVFDLLLRPAVRVRGVHRGFLDERHLFGRTVHGSGGAKHQPPHARIFHAVQKVECSRDVVPVIGKRALHGLPHCLESSEVDDSVDATFRKHGAEGLRVQKVDLSKINSAAGKLFHPTERLATRIHEVVEDDDVVPLAEQGQSGVGPDVASPAGNQNLHGLSLRVLSLKQKYNEVPSNSGAGCGNTLHSGRSFTTAASIVPAPHSSPSDSDGFFSRCCSKRHQPGVINMKPSPGSNQSSWTRVGTLGLLMISLLASAAVAHASPANEPTISPSAVAMPSEPTQTTQPTQPPALEQRAAPQNETEEPGSAAAKNAAMAKAVGVGGAEMGQRSARVASSNSKPSNKDGLVTTQEVTTEGSWMPTFGVQGLDVSGHQTSVNWQHQWNMGARFAYVKASEGNYYTNPSFNSQYSGSRQVGMVRGAYHFAIPNWSSGADQARYFVQNGGGWTADGYTMPPVLDFEFNPYEGRTINGFYFGNTCYDMTPSQLVSWVRDFGQTVKSMTGRLPVIYTNTSWWNYCTGNPTGFGDYPLWVAAYPSSPTNDAGPVPASWSSYSIWQYSSTGPFAGDSNVWNGDISSLRAFALGGKSKVASPGDFNGDSVPDLIAAQADGSLLFYPGKGTGAYGRPVKIGSGWQIYDSLIGVGDMNGDRLNDLLAVRPDGSLWFYAGTNRVDSTSQGYRPAVKIGASGWKSFKHILGVRDFNGDGRNDLVASRTDGTLWFYAGTGRVSADSNGYLAPKQIGAGWNIYDKLVAVQNFGGSSANDLIGTRADGSLWFYAGTGKVTDTNSGYLPAAKIGNAGWNSFTDILGVGDANGDGKQDLVTRGADKTLWHYAGTGMTDEGYKAAQQVGTSGWSAFTQVTAPGDFDGDRIPDLIAVRPNGTLWFYSGTGDGAYRPARQIGTGWDTYTQIINPGDFNGDGKNDLVATRTDGSLWFYAGTGTVSSGSEGYAPARRIGSGWGLYSSVFGSRDFNGDGKADLLAVRPDGTLWFYAGTGTVSASSEGYAPARKIGNSGWSAFRSLTAAGDFNGDGNNDLLATRTDGTLWFYAGTGSVGIDQSGYEPARLIGRSGWNAYASVIGAGDSNQDGKPDLLGLAVNGSLWFYAGTQMRNEGYVAPVTAGAIP